jgi:hypothetical protein
MHRNRLAAVTPLLFLLLLFFIPGCMSYRRHGKVPDACHQRGLVYEIAVDADNHVSNDQACVDRKQKIQWKRVGSETGFRIEFLDPKTPIRPIAQDCKNECRAEILPEARVGEKWPYAVTDPGGGKKYDPVIIIDNCCYGP